MKNKIYPKVTAMLFFVLFQLQSFGQTKVTYGSGIVELNNLKTVVGYIKKDPLPNMVAKISFKNELADENSTIYDTSQVKRFWIGNKDAFELLRFKTNNPAESVTVFAKMLVKGDASLYKTVYKGEELYLIKRDNALYVLQSGKEGLRKSNVAVGNPPPYREQLMQALGKSLVSNAGSTQSAFSEKNFIALVSAYNSSVNSPNDIYIDKEEPVSFLLATLGGGLQQNDGREFFLHSAYRTYFPHLSRNTSLNVGFNFYASKYSEIIKIDFVDYEFNYTSLLFSLPVEVQHNFLNKAIRPFVSAGFTIGLLSVRDQYGNSENRIFRNNIGVRPVYSGGVEADIAKGFLLKAAYRKEVFSHLALVGVGYKFF